MVTFDPLSNVPLCIFYYLHFPSNSQKPRASQRSNFGGSVLGCINMNIPKDVMYRSLLDGICLFTHSKIWMSFTFAEKDVLSVRRRDSFFAIDLENGNVNWWTLFSTANFSAEIMALSALFDAVRPGHPKCYLEYWWKISNGQRLQPSVPLG